MKHNDIQYIEKLVEAFYEGSSSIEDETILYKFFTHEDVPPHLSEDKTVFMKLAKLKGNNPSQEFDQKLDQLINKLESQEKERKPIPIQDQTSARINWRWITSIAAGVLIILSIGIFTYIAEKTSKSDIFADTYSNPEDAYIETQKTLLLVSNKLNRGFEQMETAQKNLNKTNKIVEKNIQL
ncbi:hypothetical protein LJC00_03375 [Dysgonomonas sp. OttesenSCG-928-M03]|nr:hypothetical protein [Dysgonomonas sp. OttesenSCG-928-M03]